MEKEKILITGGSGFVGAHLAAFLRLEGAEITVLDNTPPSGDPESVLSKSPGIDFVQADITEYSPLEDIIRTKGIEKIVHAAAIFDPLYSRENPYETYRVNILGTLNVLEAARLRKVARTVNVSTISTYFFRQYEPLDEYHPVHSPEGGDTVSHYGPSKVCTEVMALTYFSTNNLDCLSLRLSAVYGFGMKPLIYVKDMIENAITGRPTELKSQGPPRDIIYVKDVAEATKAALSADSKQLKHRVYLVASGKMISPFDVKDAITSHFSQAVININPILTEMEKLDASRRGEIGIDLIKKELHFMPRFDLQAGIEDYISDFRFFRASQGRPLTGS